jgi:predicted RNA polymerase sigma factor
MAYGPEAGLALLDQLQGLSALSSYHLLPSVRGDLLDKLGRRDQAREEFARAATMTENEPERNLLLNRAGGTS